MTSATRRWWLVGAALALGLGVLGGCTPQRSAGVRASQDLYAAGRYDQAYARAAGIAQLPTESARNRQAAAYLAGASAYRLNNLPKAQEFLTYAAGGRDAGTTAKAQAALGMVFSAQEKYDLAAGQLLAAARALSGEDRGNAYFYAGVAQQKMGRWADARANLSLAISNSRDAAFRQRAADQLKVTGFTLQVGAFDMEDNARRLAQGLSATAVQLKLGQPRLVPVADPGGRRRYLVQVGQFSSWPTALAWRERLEQSAAAQLGRTKPLITPLTAG